MSNAIQFALAAFGIAALVMAMTNDPTLRRWAPVVGLCGQPFWLLFAYQTGAWGLFIISVVYTMVYAYNAGVQWRVSHEG